MLKWIVKSTKKNKHQVFLNKDAKRILVKEFKTLEEAINFTEKEGGKWPKIREERR